MEPGDLAIRGAGRAPEGDAVDPSADGLLERSWETQQDRLDRRELLTDVVAALLFLLACAAIALSCTPSRPWPGAVGVALVLAYALAARVRFNVGAGAGVPTQLVLVPMLLVLPETVVAPCVALGLLLATISERPGPDRLPGALADAWHALGPVAVLLALDAPGTPSLAAWPAYVAAFAGQAAVDVVTSSLRMRIGAGIPPRTQLRVMGTVVVGDALLLPIGLSAALAASGARAGALLGVPLVGLLWLLARDRRGRIQQALDRLNALQEERGRVQDGLRRVGEALTSTLDEAAVLRLVAETAVSTVGGDAGRARVVGDGHTTATHGDLSGFSRPMAAAEEAALASGSASEEEQGRAVLACRVALGTDVRAVLSVARLGARFGPDDVAAVGELAAQGAVALQNADLHRQLREQAITDALTGLPNHRRFQETLAREGARARRSAGCVGAVLLDVDDFKAVNDSYGHLVGDDVLRWVAGLLRDATRAGDELARYGGEEFAVVVPGPDAAGDVVQRVGERLRAAVAAVPFVLPTGDARRVTVSVGVAVRWGGALDPVELLEAADTALYAAKRAGKDRVVLAAPATGP